MASNTARLQKVGGGNSGGGWSGSGRRRGPAHGHSSLPTSLPPPPVSVTSTTTGGEEEEGVALGSNTQSQLQRVAQSTSQIGKEHVCRICSQIVKQSVFCLPSLATTHDHRKEHISSVTDAKESTTMDVVS